MCKYLPSLFLGTLLLGAAACNHPDDSNLIGAEEGGEHGFDAQWPDHVPQVIDFEIHVKGLLEIMCLECHNSVDAERNAGFNMETRELMMTTGRTPPAIVPGQPENSLFLEVLEFGHDHPMNMPPAPDKIWGKRREILERWIRQGAVWPEDVRMIRPQDWPDQE